MVGRGGHGRGDGGATPAAVPDGFGGTEYGIRTSSPRPQKPGHGVTREDPMSYSDPGARHVIDRATIRMPYVSDERRLSVESWPVVTPRAPLWLRRIAEQMNR